MTTPNKNGNGVAQNGNGKTAAVVNTTTVLTVKPDEKKPDDNKPALPAPTVEGKNIPELPPVEDRILKVNQLFSLVEKHETLLETRKKLKAFKLSTDGSRDTLRIQDSRGNEFMTTNSSVIADVMETLKKSTDAKIAEVEAQIKF